MKAIVVYITNSSPDYIVRPFPKQDKQQQNPAKIRKKEWDPSGDWGEHQEAATALVTVAQEKALDILNGYSFY